MKIEQDLKYTKTHEWVKWIDEHTALVGLSDYAQEQLGDIVFVSINPGPCVKGTILGDVESVKAVSDVYAPLSGMVTEINQAPADDPASVNADPYGTWLCKITDITDSEELMDAAAYTALIKEK